MIMIGTMNIITIKPIMIEIINENFKDNDRFTDNEHDKKYDYIDNIDNQNHTNMDNNITVTMFVRVFLTKHMCSVYSINALYRSMVRYICKHVHTHSQQALHTFTFSVLAQTCTTYYGFLSFLRRR